MENSILKFRGNNIMKLFKKYLIIFSISYLSVNYAFSTNVTSELNYYKKINLPYSSNELKKYYYWGEYGLYLSPDMPFPLRFTNKEFSYKPKLFDYLAKTTFYFPHCYFYYKNILYKGVIQMATGENDGKVFTFQLYSYDNQGEVIDAILLYKVEGGEISYWNDFIINPNGKILITQYQQENLFEDDEEPKNNQIDTKTVEFQMTPSGIFNPTKE